MRPGEPERLTVPPDGRPEALQPRWRRDFPIDWPEDEYVARRDFTGFVVLVSVAFAVGQLWIAVRSLFRGPTRRFPRREIARVDEVPVGGSRVFYYPGPRQPRLLMRLADGTFVAYDQECTHLACPVIVKAAEGRLHCPCHNGAFDLATGEPVAGPPRRPLPRVTLEVRDAVIYATGVVGGPA